MQLECNWTLNCIQKELQLRIRRCPWYFIQANVWCLQYLSCACVCACVRACVKTFLHPVHKAAGDFQHLYQLKPEASHPYWHSMCSAKASKGPDLQHKHGLCRPHLYVYEQVLKLPEGVGLDWICTSCQTDSYLLQRDGVLLPLHSLFFQSHAAQISFHCSTVVFFCLWALTHHAELKGLAQRFAEQPPRIVAYHLLNVYCTWTKPCMLITSQPVISIPLYPAASQ